MIFGYASYPNSIMTKQGRLFTYTQTTTAKNGTYSFEVPYSTLSPIPNETNFNTMPTRPYTITVGDMSKTVDVGEQDVLDGGTVTVDIARSVVWFCYKFV